MIVVTGATVAAREAVAAAVLAALDADQPRRLLQPPPAHEWPFLASPLPPAWDADVPAVAWVPDLHEAFVNAQGNSTRLVTTQPLLVMQVWADALARHPHTTLVATADPALLAAHASEALEGRGAWRHVTVLPAGPPQDDSAPSAETPDAPTTVWAGLPEAFRDPDPARRLAAAGAALDEQRTAPRLLAMASACMEVNDLANAGALLQEAVAAAPEWAAAHFEQGKYHLRGDDMPAAAAAFGRAAALLPGFAAAAANWGATLGELDRPDEALAAFSRALAADPDNPQAINNVGVVSRELGRLGESEAAFRRVIALTPGLAFGHYNLGHTLFLQGRYQAALAAYQAGQRLDPARSPVQASRLALARLATGDASGALRDLQGCTASLPRDYRRQLLADTQSVAWALLSASPELRDWRVVGDWLAAELATA